MHNLSPSTALGGPDALVETIGNMTVSEVPFTALASVAARLGTEAKTKTILGAYLGQDTPAVNKLVQADTVTCFWTGSDQWMIAAPMQTHEGIASDLEALLAGNASLTEQSGGWGQFDVSGPMLEDMFERLCALPIRSMRSGDANRTRIEQIGCFVLHFGDRVSVFGPRASAASLFHALITAAKSIA